MTAPFELLCTDFDGTFYAEFANPPVPEPLQALVGELQRAGVNWVVNTGRDLSGLMEAMARGRLGIQPDYVVVVEREIYRHDGVRYVSVEPWNSECRRRQAELFERIQSDMPRLMAWVSERYKATVYCDAYSPFCVIANDNGEADAIMAHLEKYCAQAPHLTVVRNDVYARFSHTAFNKGTALAEISRRLAVPPEKIVAAGDHFNDLPMLSLQRASRLLAPANAVPAVQAAVREQSGYVSGLPCGEGLLDGLRRLLG
jgi:hypothetical protein